MSEKNLEEELEKSTEKLKNIMSECYDYSNKIDKLYNQQVALEEKVRELNAKILQKSGKNLFGKIFKTITRNEVTFVKPLSFSNDNNLPIQCAHVSIAKNLRGSTEINIGNTICDFGSIGTEVSVDNMKRMIATKLSKVLEGR